MTDVIIRNPLMLNDDALGENTDNTDTCTGTEISNRPWTFRVCEDRNIND